jgi:ADP-heptose:LPS heptosyltransferase
MYAFGNIVIFHPAAIGDAVLATPVAKTLKANFPGAKITYWSHPELRQLLHGLCPSIDDYVDFSQDKGFFDTVKIFRQLKPDLFVDLANSNKSNWLTLFSSAHVLRYFKQPSDVYPTMHAVDNFLKTIEPVCNEFPQPLFPTIFPEALAAEVLPRVLDKDKQDGSPQAIIGIVPGVGKLRPHRAWLLDGWQYLLRAIVHRKNYLPVLIGGLDEMEMCAKLQQEFGDRCLNFAGRFSLTQTAALLKGCKVVVSGDTGPAHLAVAVGTPVIGLHGPTKPQRSGPYGCDHMVIDQSASCRCSNKRYCDFSGPNRSSECMDRIMLAEIIEKLAEAIPGFPFELPDEATTEFIEQSYM